MSDIVGCCGLISFLRSGEEDMFPQLPNTRLNGQSSHSNFSLVEALVQSSHDYDQKSILQLRR